MCEHAHDDRGRDDPEVEHQAGLKRAVALVVRPQKRDEAQHEQRHLHDAHKVGQVVDDALVADDKAGDAVSDEQEGAGGDGDAVDLLRDEVTNPSTHTTANTAKRSSNVIVLLIPSRSVQKDRMSISGWIAMRTIRNVGRWRASAPEACVS